jgi:ATP adenylyltransferase
MVDRIWAGWRIRSIQADRAREPAPADDGATLFDRIRTSSRPDDETYVIERRPHAFVVLNRYPYSVGHLLVVPNRAVEHLEDLTADESHELWDTVRDAVVAVKLAFGPDGVNVGLNLGEGAGPSVPDHVHVHVVPRWKADTNFMTAVADIRVMPQTLGESWEALTAVWTGSTGS